MKLPVCAVLALVLLTLGAREAHADLILTLDDVDTPLLDKVINDNGAGDSDSAVGVISYVSGISGAVGAFTVQITTGTSKPFLSNDIDTARIKLSNTSVTTTNGGTLVIKLTDTDFDLFAPFSGIATLTAETGGVVSFSGVGSAKMTTTFDPTNNEFGAGSAVSQGPFSGAFSSTDDLAVAYSGGAFSLTQTITLKLDPKSSASMDLDATVHVPEPAGLALCAMGLLVVGARRRRRLA